MVDVFKLSPNMSTLFTNWVVVCLQNLSLVFNKFIFLYCIFMSVFLYCANSLVSINHKVGLSVFDYFYIPVVDPWNAGYRSEDQFDNRHKILWKEDKSGLDILSRIVQLLVSIFNLLSSSSALFYSSFCLFFFPSYSRFISFSFSLVHSLFSSSFYFVFHHLCHHFSLCLSISYLYPSFSKKSDRSSLLIS